MYNTHFYFRTLERQRRGAYEEDFDYPPMEPTCFSPSGRARPPHWDLGPPPPYEVAIKTTTSSTHLRRSYSDTFRPTEPLFGCSREISFEVWRHHCWLEDSLKSFPDWLSWHSFLLNTSLDLRCKHYPYLIIQQKFKHFTIPALLLGFYLWCLKCTFCLNM